MQIEPRQFLQDLFQAAVQPALPENCIAANLPAKPRGKTVVIGFGKASAAMAQTLEHHWDGDLSGVVVTRYGYAKPCHKIQIIEAAHPVADDASLAAARQILAAVSDLSADDLVICLISGGGSALLSLPSDGFSLAEQQSLNQALLKSGANIAEINCIRRHTSAIKGGRLAQACYPAKVVNLVISDVPGDELHNIASGPTVADPTSCTDALHILQRYQIDIPPNLQQGLASGELESLKPDNPVFQNVESYLIATPQLSLEAAARFAEQNGIPSMILSDSIEGESCSIGTALASISMQAKRHSQPIKPPCVILSSGETTVVVNGSGCGGSNVECALAAAASLNGASGIYALLADSDGVDGGAEIAGAFVHPDTLANAWNRGLNPSVYLANNDAHSFFQALGDSVVTGPTFTNVNDFRAFLVL